MEMHKYPELQSQYEHYRSKYEQLKNLFATNRNSKIPPTSAAHLPPNFATHHLAQGYGFRPLSSLSTQTQPQPQPQPSLSPSSAPATAINTPSTASAGVSTKKRNPKKNSGAVKKKALPAIPEDCGMAETNPKKKSAARKRKAPADGGMDETSISKRSDEEKTRNIDKKPPTMVEVNLDVSTSLDNLRFITKEKESESKEGPNLGYFPRTLCDGRVHALTRDCGDSIEILFYKGVIINKPGSVVVAVGGIPDELKIKDGLSFSYPCPSLKICKYLTYDNSELHKLHFDPFDGAMEKNAFVETLQQAYNKARGISSSSSKVQKKKEHDKDQPSLSLAMMEVNVDPSIDLIFQWSRKDVFQGYSLRYTVDGAVKFLQRDCGDHLEIFFYRGVLVNSPGFCVIAAGGIPDELKIDGGISFLYPCPAAKLRKDLLMDPAQRHKAMDDAYCDAWGPHAVEKAILQARKNLSSGSISEQPGNMDRPPLCVMEANLAVTPRTGSSSHELKDSHGNMIGFCINY